MAIKTYNQPPYFDDFDASKNYLRMLFRPGYAVQARELTQLQTVLQNQIGNFATHVFNDGTKIAGGDPVYDTAYEYVKLDSTFGSLNVENYYDEFVGTTITGQTSGVKATVIQAIAVEDSDPITLYVSYTRGSDNGEQARFSPEETIRSNGSTIREASVQAGTDAVGQGTRYTIQDGVYYVNSNFVATESQTVILSKYNTDEANARIMLAVNEKVVTVDDDVSLNDNALGSPNEAAPGAHRYSISLTLVAEDYSFDARSVDNLIQIAVIKDGTVEYNVRTTEYNEILKLLATRTYEESGNYTVAPFKVSVRDHVNGDASLLSLAIEPSVAYVEGNRIENISTVYVDLERSQDPVKDVKLYEQSSTYVSTGNFVTVTNVSGVPNFNQFNEVSLRNASNAEIGTARIRSMKSFGSTYRVYLFDIRMDGGARADIAKVFMNNADPQEDFSADLVTTGLIEDSGNNTAIFPTAYKGVKSIDSITIRTTKMWSDTTSVGDTKVTFSTGSSDELFVDYDDIIITDPDGNILDNGNLTITPTGTTTGQNLEVSTTGGEFNVNGTVYMIATTKKTNGQATPKSKTLEEDALIYIDTPTTVKGGYDDLQHADILRIKSIHMSPSLSDTPLITHPEVTDRYELDNGQRDNYYANGRIRLKEDAAAPTGRLLVVADYFTHDDGDFFTVDSYFGEVDWYDIPTFTTSSGEVINLRNVIDCRPRIDSTSSNFVDSGSSLVEFAAPGSLVEADVEIYLPRRDKLYLDKSGTFGVVRGSSALNPNYPEDPENSMILYKLDVDPYTGSPSDVKLTFVDNKRYTMRDIGRLENRINNLEYYTTLSLLEKDVMTSSTLASDGTDRFRNGFLVDGFFGYNAADVSNSDFKASMDINRGILRPHFYQDAVGLQTGSLTSVEKNGDLITLPITDHIATVTQPYASTFENLNPYLVFSYNSNLAMNPESDDWFDVDRRPAINIDLTGVYDAIKFLADETGTTGTFWNSWETQWSSSSTTTSGNTETTVTTSSQTKTGTEVTLTGNSVTQNLGDKVVDINIAPFIRSRRVYFYAGRCKPNTKMYMFFDDVDISDYTRNEMSDHADYDAWVAAQNDGEIYTNSTAHPAGANTLITNEEGEIWGSFIIPSNQELQFKTGQRVVRLTDSPDNNLREALSTAEGMYAAQGFIKSVEGTTVTTKIPQFDKSEITDSRIVTSTTTRTLPPPPSDNDGWGGFGGNPDPLAQTFEVNDRGGAFITKVDVYFRTISDTTPVTCQIREVVNGYPTKKVIAEKTLMASDPLITVDAEEATAATQFSFDYPVYLKEATEYALVLKADDDQYTAWVSELGEYDVTNTNYRITKQPNAGVLFKSANSSTWTAEQFKDLKFTIYRAKFDVDAGGAFTLTNKAIPAKLLGNDPFITYNGSSLVRVKHKNHGLFEGSKVTFTGVADASGDINGATVDVFNDTNGFTVQDVELDSYVIDLTDSTVGGTKVCDANGSGGGTGVKATENKQFSLIKANIQQILLPTTRIDWTVATLKGAPLGSDYTAYEAASAIPLLENANYDLAGLRVIASPDNNNGLSSITFGGTMTTDRDNLSPVVDTQRMSVICVNNRINNPVDPADYSTNNNNAVYDDPNGLQRFVAETESKGNSAASRYITKATVLEEDADDLKLWIKVNRPSNTHVDVYYRVRQDDTTELADTNWTLFEPTAAMPVSDDPNRFSEVEYDIENIGTFSAFQIKLVMRSSDPAKVPQVKDLRVVALS